MTPAAQYCPCGHKVETLEKQLARQQGMAPSSADNFFTRAIGAAVNRAVAELRRHLEGRCAA
jgi:hypothetical protein